MKQKSIEGQVIFCGPLDEVDKTIKQNNIGWLVSAINEDKMLDTPDTIAAEHHLKLAMNDISVVRDGLVLPNENHVQRLVEFAQNWDQDDPLMIHCWAGVSRSTAGLFIMLCHLNEGVDEEKIAFALREASPTATPNMRLVALADDYLDRGGAMVQAINIIGQGEMAFEGEVFSLPAKFE